MDLSSLMLSSVLLMIAMGLNQAESEPRLYWDMVFPHTPMPSAVEKLLPQAVVMKPIVSRNIVDGRVNFGRKVAGDNSAPDSIDKSNKSRKSNNLDSILDGLFPLYYLSSGKSDVSKNAVDEKVNFIEGTKPHNLDSIPDGLFPLYYLSNGKSNEGPKSNNQDSIPDGLFPLYYLSSRKSNEDTKSNNQDSIPDGLFPLYYLSSGKSDVSKNVVNEKINFIEGTKPHNSDSIPDGLFPLYYLSSGKSDVSKNVVDEKVKFIEGTKPHNPDSIPDGLFPLYYLSSGKSDVSKNVVDEKVKFIEGTKPHNPDSITDGLFPLYYLSSGKSGVSKNVVDEKVNFIEGTKPHNPDSTPDGLFPLYYLSSGKSDVSKNVVDEKVNFIEGTKSHNPDSISDGLFPLYYLSSGKSDVSKNVVDEKVNFIEGTKPHNPNFIPDGLFPLYYLSSGKSDVSKNVVDEKVNFIEGTKSNNPDTISDGLFPLYYLSSGKSDASKNVVDGGANLNRKEVGVNTDMNWGTSTTIFFRRNDLRSGKRYSLMLAAGDGHSTTFIPRREADSIPFSTSELPSILSRYNIPSGSNVAAKMRNTLQMCEGLPMLREVGQCVTSLEAMVDFATMSLDMHDIVAVAMEGDDAYAATRRPYMVKAVKRVAVAGGKGVVSCHPKPYAYAVFTCHHTTTTEIYSVDMIAEDGSATKMKVVAVCHLDTSMWNPEHKAFKVLGVEPGKGAACHFMLQGHMVWVPKL